jgi:hypothetical protein
MSLEHSPFRSRKTGSVADPSYTIAEFCEAERMSRSALYNLWKQGKGPRYYLNGTSRRITGQARRDFHREREADAQAPRASVTTTGEAR